MVMPGCTPIWRSATIAPSSAVVCVTVGGTGERRIAIMTAS